MCRCEKSTAKCFLSDVICIDLVMMPPALTSGCEEIAGYALFCIMAALSVLTNVAGRDGSTCFASTHVQKFAMLVSSYEMCRTVILFARWLNFCL